MILSRISDLWIAYGAPKAGLTPAATFREAKKVRSARHSTAKDLNKTAKRGMIKLRETVLPIRDENVWLMQL